MAARGRGRRSLPPRETPPAAVASVAAWDGGLVPGPEWAEGRSLCDSSVEGAKGALGAEGVRVPELPLRVSAASGARAFLCALGPLLAALRGPASPQSQLPLPSTCGGGAYGGGGARAAPPLQRRESRALPAPRRLPARLRKLSKVIECVRAGCAHSFPALCASRVGWADPGSQTQAGRGEGEPAAAQDQVPSRRIPAAIALPI